VIGVACGEYERIEICHEDLEQLRDALAVLKREHPNLTIRAALSRGVELVVSELRYHYNRGSPFPERAGRVPATRFSKKDPVDPGLDPPANSSINDGETAIP
jgi:hypothetical protein